MDHLVVVNHEEQYSIWPADRELPAGWRAEGGPDSREACLRRIDEVWTDLRPLGVRAPTGGGAAVTAVGDGAVDRLAERLADLVAAASDGEVTAADALAAEVPLPALGFASLAQLRLVDAVEREFGVRIDLDPEGLAALDDVHALAVLVGASARRP